MFNQDPEAIISKVLSSSAYKKKIGKVIAANDSYSVDSRSPPRTNDYLFKKSSASRFFEPVHPAITQGTGFSVPYGGDEDSESRAA